MRFLSPVVWSEGMYLGPHEFQVQARYFEDALHFAAAALWAPCYGLTGCTLDHDALRNGTASLLHASGILPDGVPFHMPESDPLPAPRPVAEVFPPTKENLTLLLAMTRHKPGGRNCALSGEAGDVRYQVEQRTFTDETNGTDSRPIPVRRKNVRLLLDSEPAEDSVTLPLARIRRDGSGHFIYDPAFVPPVLQIGASEPLMLMLRRLIEILESKSGSLGRASAGAGGLPEFASRDLANFWLKHAVNSGLAALRHLWTKRGHPQELFLEMSRLGGALCTFALDSHPRSMPHYDHLHPEECFDALDRHIRAHLEMIVPTNCVAIPLTQVANYFYEGDVADSRCLGRARWILGVRAQLGEADLIVRVPQLIKVCSAKFVGELVRRAMAGLALTHLPVPPPAIAAQVETQYFGISRDGPFWDHIVQTKRVGVYVPGDFPNAELELLVVLDK